MTSQRNTRRVVVFAATGSLVCGGLLIPATAQAQSPRPALSHQGAHTPGAVRLPEAAAVHLLGGPGVWTKLSNGVGGSGNEAGLLRTSDGPSMSSGTSTTRAPTTTASAIR